MEPINYNAKDARLTVQEFVDVLRNSTLDERRPVNDVPRLSQMLENANVIVTARNHEDRLIGIVRGMSDFSFCTFLIDLAIDVKYQKRGIGRELIRRSHEVAGTQTHLVLVAAPKSRSYYPHIGMAHQDACWMIAGKSN